MELQSLKLPPHRSLRTTGRGNSIGITIPKASSSQICEDHPAGALRWNPRGGGTKFGMRCHKGTPFDHVLSMISTNQHPEFLALGQCEALILQHFMSTPNTLANQAIRRNIQGGGTQQKLQSLKLSLHRSVRTTWRGH